MTSKKLPYWLAVEEGKTVRFSKLPHMIAKAMHPGDHELMSYAAARLNLENELKQAVKDGALTVRNAAGLGTHTFPHGDALQRAVLIPCLDLEPFLNARGIELRLAPHGSGPDVTPEPQDVPLAPVVAESASDGVKLVANLPWWQVAHNIPEMAQNIGARIHSKQGRPSNAAIAKEIEKLINDIERSKGRSRTAPNFDTIRGVLTGWRWKPE